MTNLLKENPFEINGAHYTADGDRAYVMLNQYHLGKVDLGTISWHENELRYVKNSKFVPPIELSQDITMIETFISEQLKTSGEVTLDLLNYWLRTKCEELGFKTIHHKKLPESRC